MVPCSFVEVDCFYLDVERRESLFHLACQYPVLGMLPTTQVKVVAADGIGILVVVRNIGWDKSSLLQTSSTTAVQARRAETEAPPPHHPTPVRKVRRQVGYESR